MQKHSLQLHFDGLKRYFVVVVVVSDVVVVAVVVVVEHAQSLEMNCRPGLKQSRFALKHFDFCFVLKLLNNFSFHARVWCVCESECECVCE